MVGQVIEHADEIYCWPGPKMRATVLSATLGRLVLTDLHLQFQPARHRRGRILARLAPRAKGGEGTLSIALADVTKCEEGTKRALVVSHRGADGTEHSHAFGQRMGMPARARWVELINRAPQLTAQNPPDGAPVRGAFDISPHWADGYSFGATGFADVSEAPAGALVIESGRGVRLAPGDPETDWLVTGRGEGLEIAVVDPNTGWTDHRSLDLRSFLIANPDYLHGQVVEHEGSTWRVATRGRGQPALRRGEEERPIGIEVLIDAHLEAFRARAVLIVDKG